MAALDAVQTVTVGAIGLFAGYGVLRILPALRHYNIPAAVVGGLLVALLVLGARQWNLGTVTFDTALQTPLLTAFFTSIGFSAGVQLLRAGSGQAFVFLALAAGFTIVQSLAGILVATSFGLDPLLGVLFGTATMAGGPATALAFAPQFEQAGIVGAAEIGIAGAMAGIVLGGLAGGPVAARLLARHGLQADPSRADAMPHQLSAGSAPAAALGSSNGTPAASTGLPSEADDVRGVYDSLKGITVLLLAMWVGGWLSKAIGAAGVTLPGYVGAMLVGASLRNLDDATGWLRLPHATIANVGTICLTLFLAVALMNLRLWELASVALPLLVNLLVQVALVVVFCWAVVFRAMGRDYDAAVMSGGFTGFMLGTTANAMAVMRAIVERFGPAPRAFLVAPIVGAFFIDFTNAIVITSFLNLLD
jgi:glutamate:Na+ symporter, ESS family